jgi:diguanylate cyclase (GGDEF)-like protein
LPPASKPSVKKILERQKLLTQEVLMYQKVLEGMRRSIKFEGLLKLIINSVRKGLGFKRAGIFLVEPDRKHFYLALGIDKNLKFEKNKDRFPIYAKRGAQYFSDVVNGYKQYFYSNNIPERLPKRDAFRVPVYNNALVPLQLGKGRPIGALAVDNLDQNRPITPADVASLINYATQVGLAIESFRTHEKVVGLSITDPMTGLYNRRFFDRALGQELSRCQRYRRFFSVLLIDIDRFKRVNDAYGHDAGDKIIRQVAGLLMGSLRSVDFVARVGGEEFAVILPETPPQNLSMVVNRLLREARQAKPAIQEMALRGESISISIGLATYRSGDATPHQMVKMADKSLYHAKRTGRDKAGPVQVFRGRGRSQARRER